MQDRKGGFFLHGGTTEGTGGCIQCSNEDLSDLFEILEEIGTPIGLTVNEKPAPAPDECK